MSFSPSARSVPPRFRLVLRSFLQKPDGAFADVLPEAKFQEAFDAEHAAFAQDEEDLYTPPVTLGAFLWQGIFKDEQRSCAAAVVEIPLSHLEAHEIGNRPDRLEPRAIKRRPRPHKLLTL